MTKLTDITPEEYRCPAGECYAVYRTPEGQLVIIGKRYTNEVLSNRIGIDESAISIPKEILVRALAKQS